MEIFLILQITQPLFLSAIAVWSALQLPHVSQVDKIDGTPELVDHGKNVIVRPRSVAPHTHGDPVVRGLGTTWNSSRWMNV